MLPPRRLDTLLTQARVYQRSTCAYHQAASPADSFSLYVDHSCTRAQFPTLTSHILAEHTDEVWRLEWSHDGRHLASTSQDKTAIIWKIGVRKHRLSETVRKGYGVLNYIQPETAPAIRDCVVEHVLSGYECPVNALAWSPDDKVLLTSAEQVIKMWDVAVCLISSAMFHLCTYSALGRTYVHFRPDSGPSCFRIRYPLSISLGLCAMLTFYLGVDHLGTQMPFQRSI